MSTHALGNVQLITVQEAEAMLNEVVVPEASIDAKVSAETTAREAADTALTEKITAVKQMEEASNSNSNSNFSFTRFKDLPIATLHFDTSNTTFKFSELGGILGTVPARYLPKYPVDFIVSAQFLLDVSSSGEVITERPLSGISLVVLNLGIDGNIKFVNTLPIDTEGYNIVNTGSATVTYITKE